MLIMISARCKWVAVKCTIFVYSLSAVKSLHSIFYVSQVDIPHHKRTEITSSECSFHIPSTSTFESSSHEFIPSLGHTDLHRL